MGVSSAAKCIITLSLCVPLKLLFSTNSSYHKLNLKFNLCMIGITVVLQVKPDTLEAVCMLTLWT